MVAQDHERSGRERRRSVAGDRLQKDARQRCIQCPGLFGDDEAEFSIGDNHCRCVQFLIGDPFQRLLEQRMITEKLEKLFRGRRTRQRP